MTIEIKNIEIDDSIKFDVNSYVESGFFIVNNFELIMVEKNTLTCLYICQANQIPFSKESKANESAITEDLFLKSLAVVRGSVEKLDLNK